MTGVPKVLLAMFDDMKYDNADGANKMFLKETIKPLIDNLIFKLNQNSYITQNNKFYIDYENPVPEDIELILKKNDNGIKNYYLTPNEARESLGYDPIQGGESLMTPLNIMPGGNIPKEEEKLKKKQLK
jgi:phage portal protein BeeE